MRKCKSCDRNAEAAVNAVAGLVAMNNAAGLELWIGHRLTHRAYACRRHVAGLQEDLPFVGGARKHDLAQHCRFALAIDFALFVCCLDHVGTLEQRPKPSLLAQIARTKHHQPVPGLVSAVGRMRISVSARLWMHAVAQISSEM